MDKILKNQPLVTVLMPVFNAEAYVAEAIKSILEQTYKNFELLIINDGSTDFSETIISSFSDPRIRYINNSENIKLVATLNKGIELSKGKYIARMDADDISLAHRLQIQVNFMEANPEIGVCGTWFKTFGAGEKIVRYPEKDEDIRIMLLYQTPFCHPSVMLRNEVLKNNDIKFSSDFIHAEDYHAWVEIASHTRFANIPEVLLHYRRHNENVSAAHHEIQKKNTFRIIRRVFSKSGVDISEEEAAVFRDVAYSSFKAEKRFIEIAESILIRLVEANKVTKFFSQEHLEKFAFEKWFHLCFNTTSLGTWVENKFRKSKLAGIGKIHFSDTIKFTLKSRLKI